MSYAIDSCDMCTQKLEQVAINIRDKVILNIYNVTLNQLIYQGIVVWGLLQGVDRDIQ